MTCYAARMAKAPRTGIPGYIGGIERTDTRTACDVTCIPNNKAWWTQGCDFDVSTPFFWDVSCANLYLLQIGKCQKPSTCDQRGDFVVFHVAGRSVRFGDVEVEGEVGIAGSMDFGGVDDER